MEFDRQTANGYASRGELRRLLEYLGQFPEKQHIYDRCIALYEREEYWNYALPEHLEQIMLCYQKYYRDSFYLELPRDICEKNLFSRLRPLFPEAGPGVTLGDLLQTHIPAHFAAESYCFTDIYCDGYHGAAVWGSTEPKTYNVELPDSVQSYTLYFLNDYLTTGWSNYLSLGNFCTGGWVGNDGITHCFWETYDLESEDFTISLLKHEAQHVRDLARWPDISDVGLEYRAYLVELCCYEYHNRLADFPSRASLDDPDNEHAVAACHICQHFEAALGTADFRNVPLSTIRETARELLRRADLECEEAFSGANTT